MFCFVLFLKLRLTEFVKKEQERAKLATRTNMKGSEWVLSTANAANASSSSASSTTAHNNNNNINNQVNGEQIANGLADEVSPTTSSINKSQSAYSLSHKK